MDAGAAQRPATRPGTRDSRTSADVEISSRFAQHLGRRQKNDRWADDDAEEEARKSRALKENNRSVGA